ncbi:MAG: peptide-methionine (S)-S-oxide reductase MsrA [Candidatus Paceibacterota bacterium]|jgi:peptide-methionine (S)-S-oxide reductase
METQKTEVVVFGGGCFWCVEAVFKMFRGVISVTPGYAGGKTENPTYEQVSLGETGHAEVVRIEFDPALVSFHTLLTIFFASHDPTTLNRQGNDIGTQYRSVIFYTTPEQEYEASKFIKDLDNGATNSEAVVTAVEHFSTFYPAEECHKDYYAHNVNNGYCKMIINPKLEKVQKEFTELLKTVK